MSVPERRRHEHDRAFLTGLTSFLGGHLAYTACFAARGGRPEALHVLPVAAVTAVTFGRLAGPLRRPVQVYALTIGTMATTARLRADEPQSPESAQPVRALQWSRTAFQPAPSRHWYFARRKAGQPVGHPARFLFHEGQRPITELLPTCSISTSW